MNAAFTARAAAAIVKSHTPFFALDILKGGVTVKANIPIDEQTGIQVGVDATGAVRRTITQGNLPDPTNYLPLDASSLVSPFSCEFRVWAGLEYSDGSVDKWAVFTGGSVDPKATDTDDDLVLAVQAADRADSISRRLFTAPYVIASGTTPVAAIQGIIWSRRADITFSVATPLDGTTLPQTVLDQMSDPWTACQDIAAAYGLEVFFNGMGVCVIRPIPDPNALSPVWYFVEGPTAIIKEVDATLTAKQSISHAIGTGASIDATSTPIRSDQFDTDPNSPTCYTGPFGDVPDELKSDLMTTQSQCDVATKAFLLKRKGAVQNVAFTTVPLTALDENDVVYIGRQRMGIARNFQIQAFTIPCYPDAGNTMNPTCRSLQI